METLLGFLRLYPHIAAQYEAYLTDTGKPLVEIHPNLWVPQDAKPMTVGVPVPRELLEDAIAGRPCPPAKGKALSIHAAYEYLKAHNDALCIVRDEFFYQVDRQPEGCWLLTNKLSRNGKGILVKRIQIHHLGKAMPAVRLARFLASGEDTRMNLYNNCGNERCVKPEHHNVGRKGRLKRHVVFDSHPLSADPSTVGAVCSMNAQSIIEFLNQKPERGLSGAELLSRFVATGDMTEGGYFAALKLAVDRDQVHLRAVGGTRRVYLKGYPSASSRAAATAGLDKIGV
jgi:hypothetical protein